MKPIINKSGLALVITDSIEFIGNRVYVKTTATIGEWSATGWAREDENVKGMSSAQVTGSTASYAHKYALNNLLALDYVKDADSMEITETPLDAAIGNIRLMMTTDELVSFFNSQPVSIQKDKQFLTVMSARKSQLKSK